MHFECCLYHQVDPAKYKSMVTGFKVTASEEGFRSLARGWAPTFFGYSMQGLCKFGFYEVFKIFYSNLLGEVSQHIFCLIFLFVFGIVRGKFVFYVCLSKILTLKMEQC